MSPIKFCFMWKMYKTNEWGGQILYRMLCLKHTSKNQFTAVRLFLRNRHLSPLDLRSSALSVASEGNKWDSAGLCQGTMSGFFHICVIIDLSGNRHRVLATPAVREMRSQFSKVLLFNIVYLMTTKPVGKQLDLCHCATFRTSIITQRSNKEQYCGNLSVCVFYTDHTSVKCVVIIYQTWETLLVSF